MKAFHNFTSLILVAPIVVFVGCDPDEPIVNPPHDCSYENTVAAINEDTTFQVECISINPVNNYPEGYVVRTVSFNPLNGDQMAMLVSMGNHDPGQDDYELGVYDLCENSYTVLVSGLTLYDNHLQWSRSGRILYKDRSKFHTIRPDGTGDFELSLSTTAGAVILNDGELLFCKGLNLVRTDSLGIPLDTIITAGGNPKDVLPDNRILIHSESKLQLFDPITGALQVVDATPETYYSHAVYVESAEAIFWVTWNEYAYPDQPESIGMTTIATQTRVFVHPVLGKFMYLGASAMSDGTIGMVRVDRQYLGGCNFKLWPRAYLINPDGTDERRLVLPF